MNAASIWLFVLIEAGLQVVHCSDDSEPLFLTPLIREGKSADARNASLVQLFMDEANVTAHSGYITVNKSLQSHLFFLYIQAQTPETAPLMLWLQGGPGLSSLFGQFLQNGPLGIDARGKTFKRNHTIQKHVNIIYLDSPVGAGYSFTNNVTGYARDLQGVVRQVKSFLKQFLILFPDFIGRDFYVAGESYGAKFAVAVANSLLKDENKTIRLKLCGTIGGVGFLGPILDIADSSNFLYQSSMVTKSGREEFAGRFRLMKSLIQQGNVTEALYLLVDTILTLRPYPSLFQNVTLYENHASALYTKNPLEMLQYFWYANTTKFRKAVHVGTQVKFEYANELLLFNLSPDFLRNATGRLERLLNESRVLLYTAQMDTVFPSANLLAYFKTLNWTHASVYRSASRSAWKPYEGYYGNAGYITQVENFTQAVLLGAGHYAALDKPEETYYLMYEFIQHKIYSTNSEAPVDTVGCR